MSPDPPLPAASVATRVLKGAIWLTSARVTSNLIGLASTLVMARLLTPTDFGLVAIASGVLAIASAVTSLPLFTVLVQVNVLTKQHLDTAWTMSALRGAFITLSLAVLALPLSWVYGDARLAPIILSLSSVMLLGGLNSPATAALTRDLQFWQDFIVQTLTKAVGFVAGVLVAWLTHSYWALVAGNIAGTLASTLISFAFVRYRPALDLSLWRTLFGFSAWLTFSQILNTANGQADQLILGWRLGANDLGNYSVGSNIAALPTREATGPLIQTLFPAFATIANNPDQLRAAVAKSQALLVAVALPIGLGFALLANRMIPLLLGNKWLPVVPIVQVLACLYGLQTIVFPTQALAMAKRENRALFVRDVMMFVTGLPFVIGGMLAYGLMGAIWGRVFAGVIQLFINMEMIHRLGGGNVARQIVGVWRSLVSGGVLVASVLLIRAYSSFDIVGSIRFLITLGSVGGVIYGATHCVLWFASGRPDGIEKTLLALLIRFFKSLGIFRSSEEQ